MPDGLGDDTVMLDEWEGEGKREERDDGKHILEIFLFRYFFFPFLALSVCDVRGASERMYVMMRWVNWGRMSRRKRYVCNSGISRLHFFPQHDDTGR
jgi:hypothetical protein